MYSKFELTLKYFQYYLAASNGKGHGIHSPFVFEFITRVMGDKTDYDDYEKIESLRKRLLRNNHELTIDDYGAGSSVSTSNKRSISSIARHALKSKKFGQLLYRVVKYYQPKLLIELGTSLGVTTSYLALANPGSKVFTLEGAAQVATIAKQNIDDLRLRNIKVVEGNFDFTLPAVLYQFPTVDFAFIDGNHRREPTENYFHWLLEKANGNSIFIFDDIHWSREMEQAWNNVKANSAVRCTIDLFFMGMVFFRLEFKEKQHFVVRF